MREVFRLPKRKNPERLLQVNPRTLLFLATMFGFCLLMNQVCYAPLPSSFVDYGRNGPEIEIQRASMVLSADPVEVDGNSALASHPNVSESAGTYYLRDLVITTESTEGHGIEIRNTDLPLVITNCTVTGISSKAAVLLSNVSHCEMSLNNVSYNDKVGLSLSWVYNVTILKDTYNFNWHGIDVVQTSHNVTLTNSTIEGNFERGLMIDSSSYNNSVYWNTFDVNILNVEDHEPTKSNFFNACFYSDYSGVDLDPRDKIGDTAHRIDGSAGSFDYFPMTLPPDRPPVFWKVAPTDQTREYGYGFTYALDVAVYGGLKEWTINHTSFEISPSGVVTEKVWLPVREYGIRVSVSNTYDDIVFASFRLTVQDTLYPTWDEEPDDQISEAGEDFRYDLNASDFSVPVLYYLENTPNFTIDAADGVITNNSTLGFQVFIIKAHVKDTEGHITNATFSVTIEDSKPPFWATEPEEQTSEFGSSFSYSLSASDYSGLNIWSVNNSLFQIDGTGTITNATYLPVDNYALGVSVNDTVGNVFTDTIIIHVVDTKSPRWVTWPADKTLEFGDTLDLQLDAWDLSGVLYWTISDTTHFDITTGGRIVSIGTLEQISYILSVRAYDPYGNYVSAGFSVTVQDTLAPIWSSPLEDHTFELGDPLRIPLDVYDPSGLTSWSIDEIAEFHIDTFGVITNATSLHAGSYLIHVQVYDLLTHSLEGAFWIHVVDTTPPDWLEVPGQLNVTAPEAIYYKLQIYDLSGVETWELNDTEHFVVDSEGYLVSRGLLSAGPYGVTVTAYDMFGNNATITVRVNAFTLFEIEIFVITGAVGVSVAILAIIVVLVFDPNRGRYGTWHKEGK